MKNNDIITYTLNDIIVLEETYFVNDKNAFELIRNVVNEEEIPNIRLNGKYYNKYRLRLFNKIEKEFVEIKWKMVNK